MQTVIASTMVRESYLFYEHENVLMNLIKFQFHDYVELLTPI